jgi:hypothetical protein
MALIAIGAAVGLLMIVAMVLLIQLASMNTG